MNCREMTDTLTGLVDGRLSLAEKAQTSRHLAACADCRGQVRWLTAMKAAAAAVPAPAMPAGLKAGLLAEARAASRRKTARRWRERLAALLRPAPAMGFGLAAGLAAAAVVLVLRVGGEPTETVSVDEMLAAHRAYALTMPLNNQETTLTGLADALAGSRP
jgi:anti-sigma factor RsiW